MPPSSSVEEYNQVQIPAPRALDRAVGALILSAYLVPALLLAARSSPLAVGSHLVESGDAPLTKALVSAALACSAVNVATHAAVVTNLLDHVPVLSVLVGVGFDVASQIVTASTWVVLFGRSGTDAIFAGDDASASLSPPLPTSSDVGLISVLVSTYGYLLFTHIRALRLSASFERLASVIRSAQNNIVGHPGPRYLDHVFAHVDLGAHVFQMIAAGSMLGPYRAAWVLIVLGSVAGTAYLLYVRLSESTASKMTEPVVSRVAAIGVGNNGEPVCGCQVCLAADGKAFTVDVKRGRLCDLWFLTFRQVLQLIDGLGAVRGRSGETTAADKKRQ